MHPRLAAVTKAYDVRGRTPEQLDDGIVAALGAAFADEVGISDGRGRAVVGHDMRDTSPGFAAAFAAGVASRGGSVVSIGLASTDMLYAASGQLDLPGVMITASHNPAGYNGLKLCRAGARPIGLETGLAAMAEVAGGLLDDPVDLTTAPEPERLDFLQAYADQLVGLAPVAGRRLRVVVDAGNGMAGHTARAVLDRIDVEVVPLYFELDGTFPNHDANPLDSSTLVDLQAAVREHGADLGLAFDGDADRCFVVDERAELVTPSAITALIASRHLVQMPGATILHNVICSRAVPEIIAEHGGTAVRTPVGHSLIKAEMARTDAVFGGEHSGHFYFRDFYLADSGMLAALHVMGALAEQSGPVSELMDQFSRYAASGEINSTVDDAAVVTERIAEAYAAHDQDRLDGLTVTAPTWWFNVRASNTEPLLRLNVEGDDEAVMASVRDDVLALVRR
ncbi:phosphoglucomutase/phosphomannomutase, alpha/beta/alpha domain II [Aeromicrobium marinum DSM 15272]|uniref:Phosphoglucomutase/phosphomannomutase, alpha/beta/alpha domain II n=1 Tax=Aeromicrobium marinum DSM 15272 TaxID=585531 RepID=E2SDU4_9ACTN|nr:phosphomannomutase/phosphoglucomutase [Aeromicrobium marinum]EFQ82671.1 phosphoglucomutase/phosphomannomutase, alpha/beta/alpha domain II [Aeromicrobium marinum DSM 15272]